MILTFFTLGLFLVCFILAAIRVHNDDDWTDTAWIFGAFLFGCAVVIVILAIIINPIVVKADILEFCSVQKTLDDARNNASISPLELAAIQQQAVEMNKWLTQAQFWANHSLTNWFWPTRAINQLQVIK